jgi:hypothetical protein
MEGSRVLALSDTPFFKSMEYVRLHTGADSEEVLLWQLGFRATPSACSCGHEWNSFDVITEGVSQGRHSWDFFRNPKKQIPTTFRTALTTLTCPECEASSDGIEILYNYASLCPACQGPGAVPT